MLCLTIVGPACSDDTASSGTDAAGSTLDPVRISTVPGALLALPQYVAEERGFFADNQLDVTLVPTASGPAAIQALLAGDVDVMLNSPDFVLQANDEGQSIEFVVGNTDRSILTLLTRTSWPVPNQGSYPEAVGDLRGATIGVTARGSVVENQLRVMLADAGLDPDNDVTIVATGGLDTAIAAFEQGQVDAWVGFEPGTTVVVDQLRIGTVLVDLRAGDGPARLTEYASNGYAASSSYIEDHPRTVRRFVTAIEQAHDWIADPANRAALEEIVARNVAVDETLVSQLVEDNVGTFGPSIPERNIDNAITLMRELELIDATPTYDDVVATEYVPAG